MDIIDLPHDLFLLIVAQLPSRTAVLCRRVSRQWRDAFADDDLSLQLLKWHFPRCREARLVHASCYSSSAAAASPASGGGGGEGGGADRTDWAGVFASVACRYHHLRTATPRSVEKIRQGDLGGGGDGRPPGSCCRCFVPVGTWDRHLRLDDRTAPFHYPDPGWCYGQEDGLLVYHVHGAAEHPWRLLDLETREETVVPFAQGTDIIVRRVRLSDGVLVFEWRRMEEGEADNEPYDEVEFYEHYVTAYDVMRVRPAAADGSGSGKGTRTWASTQRAQFQVGFIVDRHGRFFSAHTGTHYAAYFWQYEPGPGPFRADNTDEMVYIWDISTRGRPRLIRRISSSLFFYGVRQGAAPTLRCLDLDERNLYFTAEEHRWAQGGHSSPSLPRVHLVRSTGVPVIPVPSGPADNPAAAGGLEPTGPWGHDIDAPVQGPRWVDECGANGDVNMSFCSRAGDPGHGHGCGALTTSPRTLAAAPESWDGGSPPENVRTADSTRAPAGRRWPGWAPCWRHEEFPYLTVSEAVDFRAGVRVTARHCFMLETLSVHVRPTLSVRGMGGGGRVTPDNDDDGGSSSKAGGTGLDGKERPRKGTGSDGTGKRSDFDEGGGNEEVQFADGMWDALLGKGFICGDERWLIGEDMGGSITILRF